MVAKQRSMDRELATSLGLTEEELARRQREWGQQLKKAILADRKLILKSVHRMGFGSDQNAVRRLSWTHQALMQETQYLNQATHILDALSLDLASSPNDTYHHYHFINAAIVCILRPGMWELANQAPSEVPPSRIGVESNKEARLENQHTTYRVIRERLNIPSVEEAKRVTLQSVVDTLKVIEEKIDTIQLQLSQANARQARDSKADARSQKGKRTGSKQVSKGTQA